MEVESHVDDDVEVTIEEDVEEEEEEEEEEDKFALVNDPDSYTYKRRAVQRPSTKKNEIYLSTSGKYIYYVKRAKKLLLVDRVKEIHIHGLGSAISVAIKLSLYLEKNIPGLVLSPTTSTEEILDQYDPLKDHLDPVLAIRHCSAIHIKIINNQQQTAVTTSSKTTTTATSSTTSSQTQQQIENITTSSNESSGDVEMSTLPLSFTSKPTFIKKQQPKKKFNQPSSSSKGGDNKRENGGSISYLVSKNVTHYVTTDKEFQSQTSNIKKAGTYKIHVVSDQFVLDSLEKGSKQVESKYYFVLQPKKSSFDILHTPKSPSTPVHHKTSRATIRDSDDTDFDTTTSSNSNINKLFQNLSIGTATTTTTTPTSTTTATITTTSTKPAAKMTNIGDNNNKFYYLELQEDILSSKYRVLTRYGRTDGKTTTETRYPDNLDDAKNLYSFIYNEKNKKGYRLVEVVKSSIKPSTVEPTTISSSSVLSQYSRLSNDVEQLIQMIYNEATNSLTNSCSAKITEHGIETPLGVLSFEQVEKGEQILDEIHKVLKSKFPSPSVLEQLSSKFYTTIPHKMGRTKADIDKAVIRNLDLLNQKVELLQLMKDLLKVNSSGALSNTASDMKYMALKTDLNVLNTYSSDFQRISKMAMDTAPVGANITNIFKITKSSEEDAFTRSVKPTKLLFHGSRVSNFVGILSRGVLLPKVVVNVGGSRTDFGFLGAGIYFGDRLSTASIYAHPTSEQKRLVLVCEVALGKSMEYTKIDQTLTIPPMGYQSCLGVARSSGKESAFTDNEYVIYNTNQQKQQYLIEFTLPSGPILVEKPMITPKVQPTPVATPAPAPSLTFKPQAKTAGVKRAVDTTPKSFAQLFEKLSTKDDGDEINNNNNNNLYTTTVSPDDQEEEELRKLFVSNRNHSKLASNFVGCVPVFEDRTFREQLKPTVPFSKNLLFPIAHSKLYRSEDSSKKKIVQSLNDFKSKWETFTNGIFSGFKWNNVFAAGGAVLGCTLEKPIDFEKSDIDLFIYGLSEKEATEKLLYIYNFLKEKRPTEVEIMRSKYAITIFQKHPNRNVQIVLRLYKSPAEVLMGFDIDCCAIGFNGEEVYCVPRCRKSIIDGINTVSMTRRSLTYESRLFKYAKRGFAIQVPGFDRSSVPFSIYEKEYTKDNQPKGLEKLLVLEHRYLNSSNPQYFTEYFGGSDYTACEIPWGQYWSVQSATQMINYKDKSQFFASAKKMNQLLVHRHIFVVGLEESINGVASWCKKCKSGEKPGGKDDKQQDCVTGPIEWVTQNPGRQLLTGSFHPVDDDKWFSLQKPNTGSDTKTNSARYCALNNEPAPASFLSSRTDTPSYERKNFESELVNMAAYRGSVKFLESFKPLIQQYINYPTNGFYPVHYACIGGSLPALKFLVENGASLGVVSAQTRYNCMILATYYNNHNIIDYLHSEYRGRFKSACRRPGFATMAQVIETRRSHNVLTIPNPPDLPKSVSEIFEFVSKGFLTEAENLLKKPNCPLRDPIGNTILHYAVLSPAPKMMYSLLSSKKPELVKETNFFGHSVRSFVLDCLTNTHHHEGFAVPLRPVVKDELHALLTTLPNLEGGYSKIPIYFIRNYIKGILGPIGSGANSPVLQQQPTSSSLSNNNLGTSGKFQVLPQLNGWFSPKPTNAPPTSFFGTSIPPPTGPFGTSTPPPAGIFGAPSSPPTSLFGTSSSPISTTVPQTSPGSLFGIPQASKPSTPVTAPRYPQQLPPMIPNLNQVVPSFVKPEVRDTYLRSSVVGKSLVIAEHLFESNLINNTELTSIKEKLLTPHPPIFNSFEAYFINMNEKIYVKLFSKVNFEGEHTDIEDISECIKEVGSSIQLGSNRWMEILNTRGFLMDTQYPKHYENASQTLRYNPMFICNVPVSETDYPSKPSKIENKNICKWDYVFRKGYTSGHCQPNTFSLGDYFQTGICNGGFVYGCDYVNNVVNYTIYKQAYTKPTNRIYVYKMNTCIARGHISGTTSQRPGTASTGGLNYISKQLENRLFENNIQQEAKCIISKTCNDKPTFNIPQRLIYYPTGVCISQSQGKVEKTHLLTASNGYSGTSTGRLSESEFTSGSNIDLKNILNPHLQKMPIVNFNMRSSSNEEPVKCPGNLFTVKSFDFITYCTNGATTT
eukprot:gene5506-6860_t